MKDRSMVIPVIHGSMALLVTLFIAVGSLSYLAFGDDTKVIVLQNLKNLSDKPSWSAFEKFVLIAYCVSIIFTYPLQLVPPCRITERKLFEQRDGDDDHDHALKWRKNAWRTALTFIVYFVAAGTSTQLDNLVAIIGAVACVPLAYIFPALFHMVTVDPNSKFDRAIILFGILGGIMSLMAAIASWAKQPLDV
eukprot:TRINITY_DN13720_c0_g1_i1.p1 TRINITY_DN13720_c0_g1~~TRINITY_DN13720_c0_g1_i1.p1  ORF type:complete len:193 (-),score=58.19 TRINITY_DN13720_c0_g1_i1:146-724(-)